MKNIPTDDFDEALLFKPIAAPASNNPLAQYFRVPGLHIKLPTRGRFLPPESYDETLAGDVPVYPMKAADELLLRSPDALMSGYALEKLIESCVPAIRVPRQISTPDLDVVLLAIRAATYGDNMGIEVNCPKCGHENSFECHLPSIMSNMTFLDDDNEVRFTDSVVAYVRPYNLESATAAALASFTEARLLQATEPDTEERRVALNGSFQRMSKVNLDGIIDSIVSIVIPSGTVTDRGNIAEFINNTSQAWVKKIENKLAQMNEYGIDKHVDVACVKCEHAWSPEVEFDPTSFFDQGS